VIFVSLNRFLLVSMASAAFDDHVFVFLQVHVGIVEIVEHRDGTKFCGRATRFGNLKLS
jgi:hypothetical protein